MDNRSNETVARRRVEGTAEELIALYSGLFGRQPRRMLYEKFSDTIALSWGVAELWLYPPDRTGDFVIVNWHDPSAPLASKFSAYGAARSRGVTVNDDPGVRHVAMLTRLIGRAPEVIKEADRTLQYIWDGEMILRFEAVDAEWEPPPTLLLAVGATKMETVIGYAAAVGLIKEQSAHEPDESTVAGGQHSEANQRVIH